MDHCVYLGTMCNVTNLRLEDALAVGIDDEVVLLFVLLVFDVALTGPANSYNSASI